MKQQKKTLLALLVAAMLVCASPISALANDEADGTPLESAISDTAAASEASEEESGTSEVEASPAGDASTDAAALSQENLVEDGEPDDAPDEFDPETEWEGSDAIAIDVDTFHLSSGEQRDLNTLLRIESTFGAFRWSSSDPTIASIDGGFVTAGQEGTAVVTATFTDGNGTSYSQHFTVVTENAGDDYLMLDVGDTRDLRALRHPGFDNSIRYGTVLYTSSDSSIASVTSTGKVTAHTNGGATITETHTAPNGIVSQSEIRITVNTNLNSVFNVETAVRLDAGTQKALLPIAHPNYTNSVTYGTIEWSSDDPSVATVNSDGVVTARGSGESKVSALLTNSRGETSLQYITVVVS